MKCISLFAGVVVYVMFIGTAIHSQEAWVGRISASSNGVRHSIPNPNNKLSIVSLALNASVATELGLTEQQTEVIRKIFIENRGYLNGGILVYDGKDIIPTPDVTKAMLESRRLKNEQILNEALTPPQWVRLKQIAYQIEVARVGLGAAFTSGLLSYEVRVHENQKAALNERARKIEAKMQSAIAKIIADSHTEMIRELSTEQQTRAHDALGETFFFRDEGYINPWSKWLEADKPTTKPQGN